MNPHVIVSVVAISLITLGLAIVEPTKEHVQYEQTCKEAAKYSFIHSHKSLGLYKSSQKHCEFMADVLHPNK